MDTILNIWTWLHGDGLGGILGKVSMVVGFAATIAALTPTPKDDSALAYVRKVIDWLGMNILNAKNK